MLKLLFMQFSIFQIFNYKYDLTTKQKAHVLTLCNSFLLSIFGIVHNIFYIDYDIVNIFFLNYFNSYLISDLILSQFYYKNQMELFSGYIHHFAYIFINWYCFNYNYILDYQLFFIAEIPTFIKDLGTMIPKYRSNILFGSTMFLFRILYHILLTYRLVNRMPLSLLVIAFLTFSTHIYWFYKWTIKAQRH